MFKSYYRLTKPGIIYGNAITASGGFCLAAKGHIDFFLYLALLFGLSFIIASACAFNNYLDRDIDKLMARTKKRALATGKISERNAIIYASILGIIGSLLLGFFTNLLTLAIALFGLFFYVVVYTFAKRHTKYGTIIGSISGAVSPVVGYCAVNNQLDLGAFIIFLILVFWQMPHFYAIAIYRYDDYKAARIPVLPIKEGFRSTKIQVLFYIVAFLIISNLLFVFRYTGLLYLSVVTILSLSWLMLGISGFWTKNDKKWARKMFFFSLVVIIAVSLLLVFDTI